MEGGRAEKHRNDLLLIAGVLIISALLYGLSAFFPKLRGHGDGQGLKAVISLDGEDIAEVSLSGKKAPVVLSDSEDFNLLCDAFEGSGISFTIASTEGENSFLVLDGGISCTYADCPDLVCVSQGVISLETEAIVCLPHKLAVRIAP